jgi:hypothetical protein
MRVNILAMPYLSKAQRNYFHANRAKLEAQGIDVAAWDKETGDRSLPDRIGKSKPQRSKDKNKTRNGTRA